MDEYTQQIEMQLRFAEEEAQEREHIAYEQGRADKYQEIVSEYMLLTEKQVAEIRADAIDEVIRLARTEIDFESQAEQKRFVEFMEQLKEQKK